MNFDRFIYTGAYIVCICSFIVSFAKELERDINTVEKAVVSPLDNGFVEGINNRTKMIKRIMHGRCGMELLSAKIMLPYA